MWQIKHFLIAYILGNISAKNFQNQFMFVKVIARKSSDIFLRHSVCHIPVVNVLEVQDGMEWY